VGQPSYRFLSAHGILLYIKIYFANNRFPVIFAIYLHKAQHHQKKETYIVEEGTST
jgi:hypothetical protein